MRASGILMHITSLPGPYGVGSMGKDAYSFVDFLKKAGQSYWQILPLTPTGYGNSPYQSSSTFAGNPYLIDLEMLVEEGLLTREELELLPYAALIITSEDGIRFLMDHIDGDIYYNIYYPGQNLDRSRTQLKLVEDMEKKLPQIKGILRKIYKELGLKAQID